MGGSLLTLDSLEAGETGALRVVDKRMAPQYTRRLAHLGLREGARLTVVQRTNGRGLVVTAGSSRYCLDKATAAALTVEMQ